MTPIVLTERLVKGTPLTAQEHDDNINHLKTASGELDSLKANIASPTFTGTVGGITKDMVGLSNVDNTTDLLKPISTATQTALDLKIDEAREGVASGIATLDINTHVPSAQLPINDVTPSLIELYSSTKVQTLVESEILSLTNKTLDSITNNVGADHIHYKVRNNTAAIIPVNTIVTASATQPGTDYIVIQPITDPQTQIAIGIVHTTLAINGVGLAINTGIADNVDTSSWVVGTILYPGTAGALTPTKPTSGRYQACAIVLRQHSTQGTLLCEFTNPELLASTTQVGYVQLNDSLTSTSITQALTAAQGKVLQDAKANTADVLPLTGGTMTGAITALRETKVAMGANDIALASGNVFTKTITATTTLTVSGWLASGNANSFILELTNGGAFAVTYFAGVKWAGGIAPTLTAAGVDILGFYSHDGGTTVRGLVLAKDSK